VSTLTVQSAGSGSVTHVTIGTLTDGEQAWLAPDAAASYQQMRAAGMPAGGITSAGRSSALQAALYANRANNPYPVAAPGTSKHELGEAMDVSTSSSAAAWLRANGAAYGWTRPIATDPVHWEHGTTTAASNPITGGLDALKNIGGDVAAGVGNALGLADVASSVQTVGLRLLFIAGGAGLVILGLARMVAPRAQQIVSNLGASA